MIIERSRRFIVDSGAYLLIAVFALMIGAFAVTNGFVNYDDPQIVIQLAGQGLLELTPANLSDALIPGSSGRWTPVRQLFLILCHEFGGLNPAVYHLGSLVLYALLCILVYCLAHSILVRRENPPAPRGKLTCTNRWALFSALLFTASPLNVEPLAWISSVKDLLMALFFIGAVLSYIKARRTGDVREIRNVIILSVLAVGSKPSAIVLPLVLALYELAAPASMIKTRSRSLAFGLASIGTVLFGSAVLVQNSLVSGYFSELSALSVFIGGVKSYILYIWKFLFPMGLSVRYLIRVPESLLNPEALLYLVVMILLVGLAVRAWRKGHREPLFLLSWSLIVTLPSSGLIRLEILHADRYALLAVVSFAIMTGWLGAGLERRVPEGFQKRLLPVMLIVPLAFSVLFVNRVRDWHGSESLWKEALKENPGNFVALKSLGSYYLDSGDTLAAVRTFEQAVAANPNSSQALIFLGKIMEDKGDPSAAERYYIGAVDAAQNKKWEAIQNLGMFYFRRGNYSDAERNLTAAVSAGARDATLLYNLASLYQRMDRPDLAERYARLAVEIKPSSAEFQAGYGRILTRQGNLQPALEHLSRALELDSTNVNAELGMGELALKVRKYGEAENFLGDVLRKEPGNLSAIKGMAIVMGSSSRLDSASSLLNTAIEKDPHDCATLANLAALEMARKNYTASIKAGLSAAECDSSSQAVYLNLYRSYAAIDSIGQARVNLVKALELTPDNSALLLEAAEYFLESGADRESVTRLINRLINSTDDWKILSRADELKSSLK